MQRACAAEAGRAKRVAVAVSCGSWTDAHGGWPQATCRPRRDIARSNLLSRADGREETIGRDARDRFSLSFVRSSNRRFQCVSNHQSTMRDFSVRLSRRHRASVRQHPLQFPPVVVTNYSLQFRINDCFAVGYIEIMTSGLEAVYVGEPDPNFRRLRDSFRLASGTLGPEPLPRDATKDRDTRDVPRRIVCTGETVKAHI